MSQLLENDQDLVSVVPLASDLDDPDYANVSYSTAWELATLRFHVNPMVSSHADGFAHERLLQLPVEDPQRIFSQSTKYCDECFIPYKAKVKKHPLAPSTVDTKKTKRQQQVRFITPRKTRNYHLRPLVHH